MMSKRWLFLHIICDISCTSMGLHKQHTSRKALEHHSRSIAFRVYLPEKDTEYRLKQQRRGVCDKIISNYERHVNMCAQH